MITVVEKVRLKVVFIGSAPHIHRKNGVVFCLSYALLPHSSSFLSEHTIENIIIKSEKQFNIVSKSLHLYHKSAAAAEITIPEAFNLIDFTGCKGYYESNLVKESRCSYGTD